MKIAHVTATFPPYQAGAGNVCYHNARQLALRGHDVHVFTAIVPGAPARETIDGVQVHRLRPLFRIGNAPLLPQLVWRLRHFDIIHLHYPFILGAEFSRVAASLSRTPLIISIHNDLIGDGSRARLFAAYQRFSAGFTVRRATAIFAVTLDHFESSRMQQLLPRNGPAVFEAPNGVDTEIFRPLTGNEEIRRRHLIPPDARVILFVGALDRAHHYRRVDLLLKVLQVFRNEKLVLMVVGDGDRRQRYEQLAGELAVADKVRFLGQIDHANLPSVYSAADAVVLPSDVQESFGMVLIEAMACGVPVIASNLPGVRTVVSDGTDGFLAQPGDAGDLAQTLSRLLNLTAEERAAMGQKGRRKVQEEFDWAHIGQRLEDLYSQVLNAAAPVKPRSPAEVTS